MRSVQTHILDLLIIEPTVFEDERGFFLECFNQHKFNEMIGRDVHFVQDNHSQSARNVLRGLHYQICRPQGKLVRVVRGKVLDVAVDIRRSSSSFGKYAAVELSAENKRMLWVPEGFAHGFVVISETAEFLYKTTDYWFSEYERCILWKDADLAIDWNLNTEPILSTKDSDGKPFSDAEVFF